MSLTVILLIGATLSLLAGAALLWFGRRGPILDDHPYCSTCDFDLFGLPEATSRCPECGAELTYPAGRPRPGVFRVGRRARRSAIFAWGLVLVLPSGLWLASIGLSVLGGVEVERYKPDWLLAWEADGSGTTAGRASTQLTLRMQNGTLPTARAQSVVAKFLDDQADSATKWVGEKGDFIERAHLAAMLAPGQWERYIHQATAPALEIRPRVRFDGPVPIAVHHHRLRFGTQAGPVFGRRQGWGGKRVAFQLVAQIGGGSVYGIGRDGMTLGPLNSSIIGSTQMLNIPVTRPTTTTVTGPADVVRYGVAVEEERANSPTSPRTLSEWPAHSWPIVVAPPGEATVVARPDAEMASLVPQTLRLVIPDLPYKQRKASVPRDAVELTHIRRYHYDGPKGAQREERVEELALNFRRVTTRSWPLPVAWSATVRVKGVEHQLVGRIVLPAGAGGAMASTALRPLNDVANFDFGDAERVDVILRPDPDAAEQTVGITEFWDGEITFRDVPVLREPDP